MICHESQLSSSLALPTATSTTDSLIIKYQSDHSLDRPALQRSCEQANIQPAMS